MDLLSRASEAFRLDRMSEAEELYLRALEEVENSSSEEEVAAHRGLLLISLISGDYEGAHSRLKRALSIAEELGRPELIVKLQESQGDLLYSEGKMAEAGIAFTEALTTARHRGHDDLVPSLLGSLANVKFHQGDFDGARRRYQEAIQLSSRQHNPGLQAILENGLGECCAEKSDWTAALEHYERSLALVEQLDEPLRLGISHRNIGEVLIELGRFEEAESHLKTSVKEALSVQHSNFFMRPATSLAILWTLLGRTRTAGDIISVLASVDPEFLDELSPLAQKRRGSLGALHQHSVTLNSSEGRDMITKIISS